MENETSERRHRQGKTVEVQLAQSWSWIGHLVYLNGQINDKPIILKHESGIYSSKMIYLQDYSWKKSIDHVDMPMPRMIPIFQQDFSI